MKKVINYMMVLLLSACVMCCVSCMKKCEPGETQPGYCTDGTVTEQVCKDDGSGWEPADCANKYSFWNDPATDLTWQDPQKMPIPPMTRDSGNRMPCGTAKNWCWAAMTTGVCQTSTNCAPLSGVTRT